ncbi:hypothetical protein LIER_12948 [Lithospermum erythrorhizon]|uniref:Aminotransferase-like plant mobile domain-containing protein n=1 Tax=Lithospermum erythrorhizon TaxID=34254 RepID=A0AAV3PW54_LITER
MLRFCLCDAHCPFAFAVVLFLCLTTIVTFKTISDSEFATLHMVGPEEDKVTTLVVYTSLYKGHATQWPSIPAPELEKGRSWSSAQEKAIYLEGPYQDSSNPLVDMSELGGLPLTGHLFDEVVPTTECLSPTLDGDARVPRSFRFLLLAYYSLASQSPNGTLFVSAWIGLWNHSLRTYIVRLHTCYTRPYKKYPRDGGLIYGLKFWCLCILSRARQIVTFLGDPTLNSPPVSYKSWINKLFFSEDSHHSPRKHGKGKSPPRAVEDRDPKHARGTRKETSSSRGSRVVPLVRSSLERALVPSSTPSVIPDNVVKEQVVKASSAASEHEHIEVIDTWESLECFTTEMADSCPPVLPTLTFSQEAESILRAGVPSLWSCICTRLKEKSPEMILNEEEMILNEEEDTTLTAASQGSTSEASGKLALLMVSSEDLASKQQCEVQKAKELEQEATKLEARARDLRVRAQE